MRILVVGGSGFVGWQLVDYLSRVGHDVGYTYFAHDVEQVCRESYSLDVRDETTVRAVIGAFEPDAVIHAAAMTDADECEVRRERAYAINVDGTKHVVSACEDAGASMVFFSSSFVFSGRVEVYLEGDDPDPVNYYGKTKYLGEATVSESAVDSLIVRIDQPYGWPEPWQDDTMISWLIDRLNSEDPVDVFEDWFNCPIYVGDIALAIGRLLNDSATGIYHVVGEEFIDRFSWAKNIAEVFGFDSEFIIPTQSTSADLPAERPNSRLSIEKLISETGMKPRSIQNGLQNVVSSLEGDHPNWMCLSDE